MKKGLFVTLEGGDGCGKTTQLKLFETFLKKEGIPFVITEEPGGTPLGREIKSLLLDKKHGKLASKTELLLFAAARAEHVEKLILPSLNKGLCVISSRFADATWVYQGIARGCDLKLIESLAKVATGGLKPDLTFLLDVDPEEGLKRTARRGEVDKIESEGAGFQKKVREGYKQLAATEKERFVVLSDKLNIEQVHKKIIEVFLKRYGIHTH